ncbi:hypothetical protein FPFC_013540 [Fructobacillus pseudoficulneus]|uniref:Uncharacterized protein n=1 Tax=Fructobacillus pseudoficulneus TaxID=220714 RepID=A0A3F3GS43_9LACO|nr:hypothetical protein [Fructobacillus pseudoficulneus]GAP02471.1 hypothetical protein FPFC_013540 [Fructobacillus pseudoficulneus]SEH37107.1 hypothetical protein SAMN05660469_0425 [Fructobacillus pseudoficulneus]
MSNRKPAYLLLPTILVLAIVGLAYYIQTQIFQQKVRAQMEANQILVIDQRQILASLAYYQHQQKGGLFDTEEWRLNETDQDLAIHYHHRVFHRPLLYL